MSDLQGIKVQLIRELNSVRQLLTALGLDKGAKAQTHGAHVLCPAHAERSPSCSVTLAPDEHGIRVRCFGCQWSADALGLIAKVRGLSTSGRDWISVLREAARIAGNQGIIDQLDKPLDTSDSPSNPPRSTRKARKRTDYSPPSAQQHDALPVNYPPAAEFRAVWASASMPGHDSDARQYLTRRAIDPETAHVRVLTAEQRLPDWARYQGRTWHATGHRVVVPVFDCHGRWQSLRAIRITDDDSSPKRLPPAGYSARGLAMANRPAVEMLRGSAQHSRLVIVEGETDWLTWAARTPHPVIGIVSGAWHRGFADRLPRGCQVANRIHRDDAGKLYQAEIASTLHFSVRLLGVA
jgi:hypothetical protein